MKFRLEEYQDQFTKHKELELKSYKILFDDVPLITLDRYPTHFSIYWDGHEISKEHFFDFLDTSLSKTDYNELKMIAYTKNERRETEPKIPIRKSPQLDEITKDATFIRIQTDDFALTADFATPKFRPSPVMGVIAKQPLLPNKYKYSLVDLVVDYFKFTNRLGILKEKEHIEKFSSYLLTNL